MGQNPVYLFDPINDYVMAELGRRYERCSICLLIKEKLTENVFRASEFASTKEIRIWAGTMNLNGRGNGIGEDLSPWLCPEVDAASRYPHIVAVGFQEIVELSPQHIMSTEPTRRQEWEKAVKRTLNARARQHGVEEYVLLRGGQLVGASLSIFVKVGMLSHIKNVEASLKKVSCKSSCSAMHQL